MSINASMIRTSSVCSSSIIARHVVRLASGPRTRVLAEIQGKVAAQLSLRTLMTTAVVKQRKEGAGPFSTTASRSAAARVITKEHVEWPDDELCMEVPSVLKGVLTPETRQALSRGRSTKECFAAWTDVMRGMLRTDEKGSYMYYDYHEGAISDVPGLRVPSIFVIKVDADGTCPTRLMLWGGTDTGHVDCSVSEMFRMELIADFKRKKKEALDELAFLYFRGPRFFWGVQCLGHSPQRKSGECDAREASGVAALIELREYLVKLRGNGGSSWRHF